MTVVDASVVVRLLQAREDDELLRKRIATSDRGLHAPAHLDIEVLSAISGLARGGKVHAYRAARMADQLALLRITRHPVAQFGRRLLKLRDNFTVYDAAYLVLAETLGCPLLTCDTKFAKAPKGAHRAEIHTYPA